MTFYHVETRKARKQHRCEMCGRRIDPGEEYLHGVGMEGSVWVWKECAHCKAARLLYDIDYDGEYNADYFEAWVDDSRWPSFETMTPEQFHQLRHAAGYTMRWRTKGGNLLPIPTKYEALEGAHA